MDTIQGVLIFRFMAPICYLNAAVFRTRLEMECDLHKRQAQPGGEQKGCLERILPPVRTATLRIFPQYFGPIFTKTESPILSAYTRSISLAIAFKRTEFGGSFFTVLLCVHIHTKNITRTYCMHSKLRFHVKLLLVLLFFPHVIFYISLSSVAERERDTT